MNDQLKELRDEVADLTRQRDHYKEQCNHNAQMGLVAAKREYDYILRLLNEQAPTLSVYGTGEAVRQLLTFNKNLEAQRADQMMKIQYYMVRNAELVAGLQSCQEVLAGALAFLQTVDKEKSSRMQAIEDALGQIEDTINGVPE